MNSKRERVLVVLLLAVIILGGGGMAVAFLYMPMRDSKKDELRRLENRNDESDAKLTDMMRKKKQLDDFRKLSLPGDIDRAYDVYGRYLDAQLTAAGFAPGAIVPNGKKPDASLTKPVRGKKPPFVKLTWTLNGHGSLEKLVKFLEAFYKTPVMHDIKQMKIALPATTRQGYEPDELDIDFTVEALVLDGVKPDYQPTLKPTGDGALAALASKGRDYYRDLNAKNIFLGPSASEERVPTQPREVTQYVRLSTLIEDVDKKRVEAQFRDWANSSTESHDRLRAAPGYEKFRFRDRQGDVVVIGHVVKIDLEGRDVYFFTEPVPTSESSDQPVSEKDRKYYRIHVGETFEEAMRKPLKDDEVKKLGLLKDEKPGKEEKTSKTESKKPTEE